MTAEEAKKSLKKYNGEWIIFITDGLTDYESAEKIAKKLSGHIRILRYGAMFYICRQLTKDDFVNEKNILYLSKELDDLTMDIDDYIENSLVLGEFIDRKSTTLIK